MAESSESENCGLHENECNEVLTEHRKSLINCPHPDTDSVKIYKRRWYILLMYCLKSMLQNMMWNTWGPIQATARAVYDWDDYVIDLMAAWGCITFCIAITPFAWIMDVKGLRLTMILAAGLQFLGSALRCIPTDSNSTTTILMHSGQFIICLAGGMSPAALISSTWFPPNQRTTSTAISTVSSYIGTALGFIIPPAFVDDIKDSNIPMVDNRYHLNSTQINMYKRQINSLLYSEACIQFVIFVAIIIYYPAKPKIPPSLSAATGRVDFKNGIKKLFKNYNFLLLATIYGASTGVYGGWCSVLYQNLSDYGIKVNAMFAGWLGFVAVISGAFSGVSFSL
ncbi:solute carrier family 49 member 4 homolog [Dendronephthya gigantea]|uniref:solute carrier family 49 member 4 homolog n=1 Tax=Dendronephthya gigantea TaxID=151771 RepID=UPI00106BE594|nr:solute carrier family 49 member 4 homolog [Dendronephthya gigantea]